MTEDSDPPSMTPVPTTPAADRFSPEEVRRILQRASEIDAHGEHASADELFRIAREAGIDLHAMERAIAEVAAGGEVSSPAPTSVARRDPSKPGRDTLVSSILGGAAVGAIGGALLGIGPFTGLAGLGIGGLFLFALVRAAQLGRKGALLEYELQNLVTMALGMAAAIPLAGAWGEDVAVVLLMLWMVTTVLGGGLVWWLGRDSDAPDPADRGPSHHRKG